MPVMRKKCFKCNSIKDIDLFYKHSEMRDGHLNKCKSCTKKDVKKRYEEHFDRIQAYEKERFKDKNRKKNVLVYQTKRREKFPGKYRARQKVSNALRDGKIKRLPCLKCGDKKSQAHHIDYRKPFEIKWLCFICHRSEHRD